MLWVLVFFIVLPGCADVPTVPYEDLSSEGSARQLTLWMLSDIQPRNEVERSDFEQAVDDINNGVKQVDMAVIAGDILRSRSQRSAFEWFAGARRKSKVKHWFEIAGNHDVRSGEIFRRFFPSPVYYGVEIGNVLLLLLSDESVSSSTAISDSAFDWWRKMVEKNRDRILLTVTHGHLRDSGLLGAAIASRRVEGSERFEGVLRTGRVALWVSGHTHLPQGMTGTISIRNDLGGTCFVNVSSIDSNSFMDSQSRLFIFKDGSDIVWIRSRNHTKRIFEPNLDYPIRLEKPFVWKGGQPRVLFPGSAPTSHE